MSSAFDPPLSVMALGADPSRANGPAVHHVVTPPDGAPAAFAADVGGTFLSQQSLELLEALLDAVDPLGSGLDGAPKLPPVQRLEHVVKQRHGVIVPIVDGSALHAAVAQDGRVFVIQATVLENATALHLGQSVQRMAREHAAEEAA